LFIENNGHGFDLDDSISTIRLSSKIQDEYSYVKDLPPPTSVTVDRKVESQKEDAMEVEEDKEKIRLTVENKEESSFQNLISSIEMRKDTKKVDNQMVLYQRRNEILAMDNKTSNSSRDKMLDRYRRRPKPVWHAPWKLMRVIAGHHGWVRCVDVEPGNEWFVTGSADRMIKLWDLASGELRISLTGHIATVRDIVISNRHNYLFSCGEDKMVKCWDLVQNKVIRHYHGHISGVYCVKMHPDLDVLITGGRDSTARVWDIRTKAPIHVLSGHTMTVGCIGVQSAMPQVITGSYDNTVRLWDLGLGKTISTLTNHKKAIRDIVIHPHEYAFATAAADNVKKWKFPDGVFMQNLKGHNAIINSISLNTDDVVFTGADNGSMKFWDWKSGYCFQDNQTIPQPGSLQSEAGIFGSTFDHSGSRLITCEADKSIKIWREDEEATPETHPIDKNWQPDIEIKNF
jgi:pleiotropic regulator 1